jgi:hypothetical protein
MPSCWEPGAERRIDGRTATLCDDHAETFLEVKL